MFSVNDLNNLHKVLERADYKGLEEAQVAVYLSHKIKQALLAPKEVKVPDGDVPSSD